MAHRTGTTGKCGLVRMGTTLLEEVCTVVFFKKVNSHLFDFTNEVLGAKCWGGKLLAKRGRKNTQLAFLLGQSPTRNGLSHTISNKFLQTLCPSLLLPMHLSVLLTPVTLYGFLIILYSLPVNGSLTLPLNLWLILFTPVYNIQAESALIRDMC